MSFFAQYLELLGQLFLENQSLNLALPPLGLG